MRAYASGTASDNGLAVVMQVSRFYSCVKWIITHIFHRRVSSCSTYRYDAFVVNVDLPMHQKAVGTYYRYLS